MTAMEGIVRDDLPAGFGFDWSGMSYQEIIAGNAATLLLVLSVVVVFLCLAALYESWSIPVAVLLVVPIGVLGAISFSLLRGLPNDLYFKIGMITVIGLAAKNAILIVEFAVEQRAAGKTLRDATIEAAHLRFRPILMTSFAFILGVLPMAAISTGAGANARHSIGTGRNRRHAVRHLARRDLHPAVLRGGCGGCWATSWTSLPGSSWKRRPSRRRRDRIADPVYSATAGNPGFGRGFFGVAATT